MSWHQVRRLRQELAFLHDRRLETFALQLEREDWPVVYPQFTSSWYIEGLHFCCEAWQHRPRRLKSTASINAVKEPTKVTGTDSQSS